MNDLDLTFV